MNTRPAWGVLFLGAIIVVALLFSPLWLDQFSPYIQERAQEAPFPEAFYVLSNEEQDLYNEIYAESRQMAIDLIAARLITPTPVEEPYLPALDANPAAVQTLLNGTFVTISPIRGSTGTATLYRLSDGRRLLRLEDLDAVGGPDLHVLLSAYPNPSTQEELDQVPQLQIDLGELKSSQGNQNYFIEDPAFNIDNYVSGSVVIYSTRYQLVFSYASLIAPGS
jgi:hypothetical protein